MISWTDVVNVAPELSGIPSAAQTALIAKVYLQLNPANWPPSKLDLGAAWLAAHFATLARRNGAPGAMTSEKAGDIARAFADVKVAGLHSGTSYGREFDALVRTISAFRFDVSG